MEVEDQVKVKDEGNNNEGFKGLVPMLATSETKHCSGLFLNF